ncbi:hypothetical protein MAPG_08767 [Magnaporthiopsis poae ATCC 64411]|uniref:Uncharacterized protein n=1 Tax=Magnaporthiopsis poae (strain ATCC 64411 / 73-15) TaxID=644358 RepID=A0A0C4E875_MAGP6|nr:hypothetical protein MAPG_08767 [Magnaporthiopsis poae ATCC 64411]
MQWKCSATTFLGGASMPALSHSNGKQADWAGRRVLQDPVGVEPLAKPEVPAVATVEVDGAVAFGLEAMGTAYCLGTVEKAQAWS